MEKDASFWRHPRLGDLCLFKARFTQHRYDLHTHPTYVVALITEGCERLRVGRRSHVAPIGTVIVVNPEEMHDGEPGADGGWAYRTIYPSISLMSEVAREVGHDGIPFFPETIVHDDQLACSLMHAHLAAEGDDPIEAEASMLSALGRLVAANSDIHKRKAHLDCTGAHRRLALYIDAIESKLAYGIDLEGLAHHAGVTRFQVIRDFKRVANLTPGAYMRNRRVQLARRLIEGGMGLAEASAASGFSDQSHLSRVFKSTQGMSPGTFRRAWLSERYVG